ncbi:MAG: replication initiation protein [Oscillospiraceae bacterium]|jgi:hypothetical protein|nr:replication initiation protein [Oscillospiraceae bacterium]
MSDMKSKEREPFAAMYHGNGSNKLSQITTRSIVPAVDAVTGDAVITDGDYTVFIEEYRKLTGGLRISTHKLLDACIIALSAVNHYRGTGELATGVSIPLNDYVAMLGKNPAKKNAVDDVRKRVKEDLEALYRVSIEWSERARKKTNDYAKMRILSSQGIKGGCINVGFSPEFVKYLTNAYVMQYPTALLKTDERNPSSYHIGRKLLLQYSNDNNLKIGTHDIISVLSLLAVCPDIPSYDVVINSDRELVRRIMKPFQNALNALGFIKWRYAYSKGKSLTKKQLSGLTYQDFEKLYIKFAVKGFHDQTARLAAKAEEAEAKAKAQKKKAAPK